MSIWRYLRIVGPIVSLGAFWGGPPPAAEPVGAEFQINSYTTGTQQQPAVAEQIGGDFWVLFSSEGSSGDDSSFASIQGQRLSSDGAPIGAAFQVNAYTTGIQGSPALAARPGGGAVAVWQSEGSVGDDQLGLSIAGRLFNSDGSPAAAEFQVNSLTVDAQSLPDVSSTADGGFVVVWQSNDPAADGDLLGIRGQRFASDGQALGAEFQVNAGTLAFQEAPKVAVDDGGGFVVTWHGIRELGGNTAWARRFDSTGAPIGDDFDVIDGGTENYGLRADVAAHSEGGFVVAWLDYSMAGENGNGIRARRFDSAGSALTAPVDVSPITTAGKTGASIAQSPDGGFFVAWESSRESAGDDTDLQSVQGRGLDAEGRPTGAPFQVNTVGTGSQWRPQVATGPGGRSLVVWQSDASSGDDSSDPSIQGQLLFIEAPLFADDFEAGDISAWDAVQP